MENVFSIADGVLKVYNEKGEELSICNDGDTMRYPNATNGDGERLPWIKNTDELLHAITDHLKR